MTALWVGQVYDYSVRRLFSTNIAKPRAGSLGIDDVPKKVEKGKSDELSRMIRINRTRKNFLDRKIRWSASNACVSDTVSLSDHRTLYTRLSLVV
jgi:hypothetical protein